jgi:hypothetical protein
MFDLNALTARVQQNCHISDAQFAGHYTLCVFLLKMREFYRWEKQIPLSHSLPKEEVGIWLSQRELVWEGLDDDDFHPIEINGREFSPFDNEEINEQLNPQGLVYSGGYGLFHKPCFFLGRLERKEDLHDKTFMISSRELARDLMAPPAMFLNDTIYIRQESLRRLIWERIDEWRMQKQDDNAMGRALAYYDMGDMESLLDQITQNELETLLLHEQGEAEARKLLGREWEEMLHSLPRSRAELLARGVRDHLADCLVTLPALLETDNPARLHFYFANFTGMRKALFPEAMEAYRSWVLHDTLAPLTEVCEQGRIHWLAVTQEILAGYEKRPENAAQIIESVCALPA